MKQSNLVLIITLLTSIMFAIQGCGSQFDSRAGLSSIGIPVTPAKLLPPNVKVTAPSHIARDQCAAVTIEKADPTRAVQPDQTLRLPEDATGFLFSDSDCRIALANNFSSNNLPATLYFKSRTLFQDDLFVTNGASDGPKTVVTVYKDQLISENALSPGFFFANPKNLRKKFIATNTYNGPNTPFGTNNPSIAIPEWQADSLLGSTGFSTFQISINKTGIWMGDSLAAIGPATAIIGGEAAGGPDIRCFATSRDVYCLRDPEEGFLRIELPIGRIFDLAHRDPFTVCASVEGKAYCWNAQFFVGTEVPNLGTDIIMLANARTSLCAYHADQSVACVANLEAEARAVEIPNASRIFSGGRFGSSLLIEHSGGALSLIDVNGDPMTRIDLINDLVPRFDEIYNSFANVGCGRVGFKVYCYDARATGNRTIVEMTAARGMDFTSP